MKGYMGKVLIVDLTKGTSEYHKIPDKIYENVLSGSGLGNYMIYRMIPAGADPLGPDNVLGLTSGLATGTGVFGTGRWMAVCKSPLTGGLGEANCGGSFSPALKQCGVDAIFFTGRSENPVYVFVDNNGVLIKDASHVWGKDGKEVEKILLDENSGKKKPRAVVIGQAGENMSLLSGIINDGGRIAARSGVGAVMGSKNLKAVLCAGTKQIKAYDQKEVFRLSNEFGSIVRDANLPSFFPANAFGFFGKMEARSMKQGKDEVTHDSSNPAIVYGGFKRFGTSMGYGLSFQKGDAPVKNWKGTVEDMKSKDLEKIGNKVVTKAEYEKYHCYSCPLGCGGKINIEKYTGGKYKETHKPEYETQAMLGSMFLNSDPDAFFEMIELCNRAGIDTIGVGGSIAFAIECYEKGILTKEDTDGLELTWGNGKAALELLKKMIKREPGIGALLADGPKKASEIIGKGSDAFAITAGGQPLPAHDPRVTPLLALQYSGDPSPGKHTSFSNAYDSLGLWKAADMCHEPSNHMRLEEFEVDETRAKEGMFGDIFKQVLDGIGACILICSTGIETWPAFDYTNAVTGWGYSGDDYMNIGRRISTLRMMFLVKQGVDPKTFFTHKRALSALPAGATKDRSFVESHDQMVGYYWKSFGWDQETGAPLAETIKELGLDQLLNEEVGLNV